MIGMLQQELLPKESVMQDPMLQFFEYRHLPADLQNVSSHFCVVAEWMCLHLPRNPERTVSLRKLLEAKDCAVRAQLYKDDDKQVSINPYGRCPTCGAPGLQRERGLNGNDICEKGHHYPSKDAVKD